MTEDAIAAAEREVVEAAIAWAREDDGSRTRLDCAVFELLHLRAVRDEPPPSQV